MRVGCSLILILALWSVPASGDVLDDVRATSSISLGFRTDAAPFSYIDDTNQAAGFSIDLCRRITEDIGRAMGGPIATKYVPVDVTDRFAALANRSIDLLCGATTVTMSRRRHVDFTVLTFVTGGTFMTRASSAEIELMSDKSPRIGVLAATTSHVVLNALVAGDKVKMRVVPVETHDVAIGYLLGNVLDGYFGDQQLLYDLRDRAANPGELVVSSTLLTVEPYAIAIKKGEDRLRLLSDATLARLYRSGEIYRLIERWFPGATPSPVLRTLYLLQGFIEE